MLPIIILGILLAIVIIVLISNIVIVPQARAAVIERLGTYHTTWHTGFHFRIPFVERISKKVSLMEQVADFPPQAVITKDNVKMQIDTVVLLKIKESKLFSNGVVKTKSAI